MARAAALEIRSFILATGRVAGPVGAFARATELILDLVDGDEETEDILKTDTAKLLIDSLREVEP